MKVKLLRQIRKESEKGLAIILQPDGRFKVTHDGYTWDKDLTREQAIEKYRKHVYYSMENKIKDLRKKEYNHRRIKFSLWK